MHQEYEVAVGLEIHAELCTKTKIFCGCKNAFGAKANTLCCPVCMGLPGALPVLNRQAVDDAIRMGLALHCSINRVSRFERKNYFYPDLPKAYQITQLQAPLCGCGYADILVEGAVRRIGIARIQLEEDAGKLLHDDSVNGALVDYNRCGVPLLEIVSEPDLRSAGEAKAFLEAVAGILLYLGISDAKMQEGSVRADVNVSVRPRGQTELGARTEMKNVSSFGAVYRAVRYEVQRQMDILRRGGIVAQETRRWDDRKGESRVMRTKEAAPDYRFFPDPDLPVLAVSEAQIQALKKTIPELPVAKALRYLREYGFLASDAQLLAFHKARSEFFDSCAARKRCAPKSILKWLLGDVARLLNERRIEITDTALTSENLTEMIALIENGTISVTAAKTVLEILLERDTAPARLIEEMGLAQISDPHALSGIVEEVLAQNQKAVADYRCGKTNALGFLVGQCMKASKGKGNAALLRERIVAAIEKQ